MRLARGAEDDLKTLILFGDAPFQLEALPRKARVMKWFILVVAGLLEIGWAIGLKYTEGFTRLWPSVGTIGAMAASITLLGMAMKHLPVGTAYAIWVGIGAVGATILGIVLFNESTSALKISSVLLIVAGVIGLKLASSG